MQWALDHIPADARLYTFGLTEPLQALAPFEVRELYDETPQTILPRFADGKTTYLYVNIWVIANQWAGRDLEKTYDWLRDASRLGIPRSQQQLHPVPGRMMRIGILLPGFSADANDWAIPVQQNLARELAATRRSAHHRAALPAHAHALHARRRDGLSARRGTGARRGGDWRCGGTRCG